MAPNLALAFRLSSTQAHIEPQSVLGINSAIATVPRSKGYEWVPLAIHFLHVGRGISKIAFGIPSSKVFGNCNQSAVQLLILCWANIWQRHTTGTGQTRQTMDSRQTRNFGTFTGFPRWLKYFQLNFIRQMNINKSWGNSQTR